jgi:formate dehydrogenase subunit gamma
LSVAEETAVPITTAVAPEELVARLARPGQPLLTILHAIQEEAGHIPEGTIAPLARAMNLSRAEVYGFITYYHHFRTAPPAPIAIQLCRAEACQSMGAEALASHIEQRTGCRFDAHGHGHPGGEAPHAGTAHAGVSLESTYCLGQCALSPSMMINERVYARVTPKKFDTLLQAAQQACNSELKESV